MKSSKSTTIRLSPKTRRQLQELARQYKTMSAALTVAVDRLYNSERSAMPYVTAAQLIAGYVGPEWLIEPVADPSDPEDVAAINEEGYDVLQRGLLGWGPYNAIIRVDGPDERAVDTYYLARLA